MRRKRIDLSMEVYKGSLPRPAFTKYFAVRATVQSSTAFIVSR